MKLSGEATLNATVTEVYAALNNPAILVRTIPGCQQLEQVGPDSFKATVTAGVASIKGTFNGAVRLSDQVAPNSFTLHASGAGAPGTVSAVARVALSDGDGGGTLLRYDADATIGGVIGGVGQRMLTGVARKTAAEFFAAVDRELAGVAAPAAPVGAPVAVGEPAGAMAAAAAGPAVGPAPSGVVGEVWTRPAPVIDAARQRARDLFTGAVFGAVIALLGVLVGAIVARW
jgi:carbon monoxide dehydrogenase subunit G